MELAITHNIYPRTLTQKILVKGCIDLCFSKLVTQPGIIHNSFYLKTFIDKQYW